MNGPYRASYQPVQQSKSHQRTAVQHALLDWVNGMGLATRNQTRDTSESFDALSGKVLGVANLYLLCLWIQSFLFGSATLPFRFSHWPHSELWLGSRAERRRVAVLFCPGQKIFSFPLNRVIDRVFRIGKLKAFRNDFWPSNAWRFRPECENPKKSILGLAFENRLCIIEQSPEGAGSKDTDGWGNRQGATSDSELGIMVTSTRRQLVVALITGLLVGVLSASSQAGIIVSLYGDDPFSALYFGDSGHSWDLSGMSAPSRDDKPEQPTEPLWPELLAVYSVVGMQGLASSGMSGVSTTVGPQSSSNSLAAVLSAAFDLCNPPLRGRLLDEVRLVLPSGPIFELLRPA